MTSRAQRNRREREKRRRPRPVDPADAADLPRPLRLVLDASEETRRLLIAADGDPGRAAAAALAEARAAAAEVATLAAPFDAFDVLELVRLSQSPMDPETYRETDHEGSPAVIELVALVLAARGDRSGTAPGDRGRRARPDLVMEMDRILHRARDAINVGSLVPFFQTVTDPAGGTGYALGVILREVFVRNLSYGHMEEDTLVGLFGGSDIEADCRSHLGCTVQEIRTVFDALVQLHTHAWQERFSNLNQLLEVARSEVADAETLGSEYQVSDETRGEGRRLWSEAWDNPADCSNFTIERIAAESGTEVAVVNAVIGLFGIDMAERDPAVVAEEFLSGQCSLRCAPILRDRDGSVVVIHHSLLVPAIRERAELALRGTPAWNRYVKHRGDYLEAAAVALLEPHFPGCEVLCGYEYYVPNRRAMSPEQSPEQYTSVVEGDALLLVDDVAIIVEAKAGGFDPLSRSGHAQRLYSDLRKIVTDAADQAERVRARIEHDSGLRLRNGEWLDLGSVREIYSITVSLEDLSGIATVTSELAGTGLLPFDHLPWTVSLHDLRVISELVAEPAELVLYLRRRTEPDVTRRFHAVDELDFFLQFYANGLYVEPDPERVQAELPQFGEPTVATRRRYKRQLPTMLLSRTDQLDAWYFYTRGIRHTPARKPVLNANSHLYRIVSELAAGRGPGCGSGRRCLTRAVPFSRSTRTFLRHSPT